MKKLFLTALLITATLIIKAQEKFYNQIVNVLNEQHPEINTDSKLLAVGFWSSQNSEGIDLMRQLDRVATTYQVAKLKGGLKGVIVVLINPQDMNAEASIAFGKEGFKKLIPLKSSDFQGLNFTSGNLIFNSAGEEVYRNLSASEVFPAFNQLITR